VCIIPHTAGLTTVGFKPKGERVNIEADMIGKYVERFLSVRQGAAASPSGVTAEMLARAGFMK